MAGGVDAASCLCSVTEDEAVVLIVAVSVDFGAEVSLLRPEVFAGESWFVGFLNNHRLFSFFYRNRAYKSYNFQTSTKTEHANLIYKKSLWREQK